MTWRIVPWDRPMSSLLQKECSIKLQSRYPWVESQILTWTAHGREVELLKMGQGGRKVLLTAAHHANESISGLLLWRMVEDYCRGIVQDGELCGFSCRGLFKRSTLYAVPVINPDGCDLVAGLVTEEERQNAEKLAESQPTVPFPQGWKANLRGVDLNLNYPARWETAKAMKAKQPGPRDFPGFSPLDQEETAALAELARQIQPDVIAAWHTQGRELYADGNDRLFGLLEKCSGYRWTEVPEESANGGFRDWFWQEFHRFGVTIEAGYGENPLPLSDLPKMYEENLPIFVLLLAGLGC